MIARPTFAIAVKYDSTTVSAEVYQGATKLTSSATVDSTDTYSGKTADLDYKFVIEPKDNAKISEVSYTLGDSETPEVVKAKSDGSYVFTVKLTDDLNVTVTAKDEYDLVVKEGETPVTPDSKKVYNVGHASTVTAQLLNGTTPQALFNAEVKDGSNAAATIARISGGNLVTLEFDSSEYNKVLTVVLTLSDRTTKKEFKVKTTAAAAEVSITGVKGGKVDLPVDTAASYKLTVKTKNASLAGIGAKVVPANDEKKTDAAEIEKANAAVSAEIVDGNLVITAKPAKEGAENAAKVIIVDESGLSDAEKAALTVDNVLKNGVVTVNTKNATIDHKSPTLSLVSTTDQTIKVKLGVPKGVVTPVSENEIYYKVELTVPDPANVTFPEGTSPEAQTAIKAALTKAQQDWNTNNDNLYQAKEDIDAESGLLEIPVMKFDSSVAAELQKGVLLSGFSVKATLLQTTVEGTTPATAASDTIITSDVSAELRDLATKNPYYEVKLGLKKGTTTLITGQNKDVVVATPNFNKLTSYSTVEVKFVNTSTGKVLGAEESDVWKYKGLSVEYSELQNAVLVNAKGASYTNNANGFYKNLGVKITAYAEDSAYGAVAIQKLTVVNGIENINPAAPLEIYKQDDKATSFTVTTDLNGMSSGKQYAPKKKNLKYQIVAADGNADNLSADLKANVTVNNKGKVSINKKYVVKGNEALNKFKVKVTAADYPESTVAECTEVITITGQPMKMGTIAVFDIDSGTDSAKLVALDGDSLAATEKSGEFQVAVLLPTVKTTKKTYDLTSNTTVMDPALFTFKSGNAKSVAIDEDGALTVNKAAKNVKITATPKDGSKLDKKLITLNLKTVGQVSETPMLKISRYKDSTGDPKSVSGDVEELYAGGAAVKNYNGSSTNNYFKLEVVKPVTVDGSTTYVPFYLANYKISFNGAKQICKESGANGDVYKIVANTKEAKITLTNKAVSGAAPVVYKLINDDYVSDSKMKAPTITTSAKLAQYTGTRLVSYNVKGQKKDDFTGDYVLLSADQTKKNPTNIGSVLPELDKPLPIIVGQSINLKVNTNVSPVGNYNLVATVGSLENGVFTPLYKDAKVVVKITKQGKANLSVTGNYTLPLKNYSGIYLKYKSGNGQIDFTNKELSDGYTLQKNYAKNAVINGKENNFRKYFDVKYAYEETVGDKKVGYGGIVITLKPDLPLTAAEGVPSLDKIVKDAYKNDRIGYISVNNGEKFIDVKLTITLKDETKDKTKYKATATPVLAGPNAVTALTITEGKSPVDAVGLLAESVGGKFKPVTDARGNWYLEAADLTAGNHKVDLYIVSNLAADAYLDAISTEPNEDAKKDLMRKYGIKTSVTVKASAKTTAKKVVLVDGNKWNVADTDYVYDGWTRYAPFKYKTGLSMAANTDVIEVKPTVNGKEAAYVSVTADKQWMTSGTVNVGGKNQKQIALPAEYDMTIKLDRAKLVKAIADDAADNTIAKKNKLDWGKTVKVKLTFSYGAEGADVPKADEVTVDVKLPADPTGIKDTDVTKALTDAQDDLQSNIETCYKNLLDRYDTSEALGILFVNVAMDYYVEEAVKKVIKGADVTVAITDNGNIEDGSEALADTWTVVVKSKAAGTAELYNHSFAIPTESSVTGIETAIASLTLKGGTDQDEIQDSEGETILKVTASTTKEKFAAAVREALGAAATRNISITAKIEGEPKKPTTEGTGEIKFVLTIKDLSKKPSVSGYSKTMSAITYTLPKLDNLTTCKGNVTSGLNAAALTKIVQDAYKEVKATGTTLDAKVKDLVVAKANELIDNNPAIRVTGFAMSDAQTPAPLFSLTTPTTGVATDGKISFTLQLTEEGKTADELKDAAYKLEVSETTLQAIAEFQTKAELLVAIKAITEIDYAADKTAAITAIKTKAIALSKNPAYNPASIVVEETPNTAESGSESNGSVFTAPGESDGSITKVIVKVGTEDSDKDTIATVTIKKQETPAT